MGTKKTPVQTFRIDCVCEDCGIVCKYRGEKYNDGCKEYVYHCEECGKDYCISERYPQTVYEDIVPEGAEPKLENPVTEENLAVGVVLRHRKDDYKFVVCEKSRYPQRNLETIRQNMDDYEYVCDRPHADGDFSYMCNGSWCRCQQ